MESVLRQSEQEDCYIKSRTPCVALLVKDVYWLQMYAKYAFENSL